MLKLGWIGKTQNMFVQVRKIENEDSKSACLTNIFHASKQLIFSLQVVSKRFSSKNKFTGLICKTATPFVQVWHSKELQKWSVECIQEENIQFLLSNKAVLLLLLCWLGAKKKRLGTRWRSACIVS